MTAAVRLQDVTVDFGPVRALDGISLTVDEGAIVGVLGRNGAGKTTAIRVAATLLTAMAVGACNDNPLGLRASLSVRFDTLAAYTMSGTPVTFPAAFDAPYEANPFLGWRSIRVCLDQPEIFRPQLRALLRAAGKPAISPARASS